MTSLALLLPLVFAAQTATPQLDVNQASQFAALAQSCIQREYPNQIRHLMDSDDDIAAPRQLTPAFYGCFDWHSAVHGHWLLARLSKQFPDAEFAALARTGLSENLSESRLLAEAAYMASPARSGFERPYGLAWLLQLVVELQQWDDSQAQQWREHLRPLEALSVRRLQEWIPKLQYPIRGGEHFQTAFAFGLIWDYAVAVDNASLQQTLRDAAERLYAADQNCPLAYEPSGHDFLSPCLAEADFMRRVQSPSDFADWLTHFMPTISTPNALPVGIVTDRADGKLAHIDGLNLSRAWMLEGIAAALPARDERRAPLRQLAQLHARAGMGGVSDEHYAGGHWLASFAVYLVTQRGLR